MIGALFFKPSGIDVSAHLHDATMASWVGLGLLVAFFLTRPELWRRMWFRRVDPRPLGLVRIAFSLVLLWTFLDLLASTPPLSDSTARYLFTDEGLWPTDLARRRFGGDMGFLYHPEHGFEHAYDIFLGLWSRGTILHLRSDPPFVFSLYAVMCVSMVLMMLGVWTRTTTIVTWILVETIYRYSPIFYAGGDTVTRVFLFLAMFSRWGEAYSIDSWRRRRRAVLTGATTIPPLRRIAAWPQHLMMLQLVVIYCATGLLKSGSTWSNGTALYYALSLDHFYRFPQTGFVTWAHYIGILPITTIVVRYWEVLFPLALIGVAVNGYERERDAGLWPGAASWRRWLSYGLFAAAWAMASYVAGIGAKAYLTPRVLFGAAGQGRLMLVAVGTFAVLPACVLIYVRLRRLRDRAKLPGGAEPSRLSPRDDRASMATRLRQTVAGVPQRSFDFVRHWILGRRLWLVIGLGMHVGIDLLMNVGTFAEVMMAVYPAWLCGDDIDKFWWYALSRPLAPGEGDRPVLRRGPLRPLRAVIDRLRYRGPGKRYVIHHHPDEASARRAATLRLWDLGGRLSFVADPEVEGGTLSLEIEGKSERLQSSEAARWLVRVLPGLWLLRPFRRIAGFIVGPLSRVVLSQR